MPLLGQLRSSSPTMYINWALAFSTCNKQTHAWVITYGTTLLYTLRLKPVTVTKTILGYKSDWPRCWFGDCFVFFLQFCLHWFWLEMFDNISERFLDISVKNIRLLSGFLWYCRVISAFTKDKQHRPYLKSPSFCRQRFLCVFVVFIYSIA